MIVVTNFRKACCKFLSNPYLVIWTVYITNTVPLLHALFQLNNQFRKNKKKKDEKDLTNTFR